MKMRRCLPFLAVALAACATTPPPKPQSSVVSPQSFAPDAIEYRRALEETIEQIEARDGQAGNEVPAVDAGISMPIPEHPSIASAVALFTGRMRNDIQTYLTRSGRYKSRIDKVLDEYQLPRGLAYLPVIESGYGPTLTSRAGAHGIWQFMPDTAREYGMRVDWWIDERAEEEKSTRAAVEFLKDLYREFNDWPLALAAYNAGPGKIRRALAATGATTFWELLEMSAVPKETRGYVPTFFATLIIAMDPDTYGFELGKPVPLNIKHVEVQGPVSLQYLSEVAEVDEADLRALNPALRRGVVPPGRWRVQIPEESASAIEERASTLRNEDALIRICSFTLRRGDSVTALAKATGASVDTILAMNDAKTSRDLRAGDSIYLPVRARELGSLLSRGDDKHIYYAVRKGDTLYSIAKKHNLTIEELRDLNQIAEGQKLRKGQRLRISRRDAVTAGGM